MRVAVFTPVHPVRSALSDIIEGLLPHWIHDLDVCVVTSGTYEPDHPMFQPGAAGHVPWISYEAFKSRVADFDLIVYNLGDEATIHGYMFDALHRHPGLVLLHDLVLHHAVAGLTWAQGKLAAYVEELRYSYADDAERIAAEVNAGHYERVFETHPLVERVLDSSLAVIGFNGYICGQVRDRCRDLPVRYVPLPFYLPENPPDDADGAALRSELGLSDCPVIASFGLFNSQKRLELALRAFRRLLERRPEAVYLLVGSYLDPELEGRLAAQGLQDKVRQTGWQPLASFVRHMKAVDVAVHLRYPHVGGTPYTPLRLLGLGVPTIISEIEPLAELPQDGVVRIVPDQPDEEAMIFAAMDYLLAHRDVARAMARRGQRYVRAQHAPERVAGLLADFMREVAANRDALASRIPARRLAVMGMAESGSPLCRVAGAALAELGVEPGKGHLIRPVAAAIQELEGPRKP